MLPYDYSGRGSIGRAPRGPIYFWGILWYNYMD